MWCSARPRALPPTSIFRRLDGSNGFKLSGVAAGDYSGFSVASAGDVNGDGFADLIVGASGADPHGSRFRRELCGVRQGLGLCREPRSRRPRRQHRLQAQRRGGVRPQRLFGRLGGRRQRRRLRRPDRRRPRRRSARQLRRARAMWCSARPRASPRTSISRPRRQPTASSSAASAADDDSGVRSPRPATSTATASPT